MLISPQQFAAAQAIIDGAIIPVPDGIDPNTEKPFSYLPYQIESIHYASKRPATLVAEEMGLGKSVIAVGVANNDELTHRVLIICPSTLKQNWRKEFSKWDVKHLSIGTINSGSVAKSNKGFPDTDVVIINYELVKSWSETISKISWDLLIVDEAHYIKGLKTIRTVAVLGHPRSKKSPIIARRKLFLTGTPIINKPADLWPIIRVIDPDGLGKHKIAFEQRYCDGKWVLIVPNSRPRLDGKVALYGNEKRVWQAGGSTNPDELQVLMREKFMTRHLKAEVLKDLPNKRRQIIVVEPDAQARLLIKQEKNHPSYEEYIRALEESSVLESPAFQDLSRVRKETAVVKVPFVVDYLKDILRDKQKVVIFVHHHEVGDSIESAMKEIKWEDL